MMIHIKADDGIYADTFKVDSISFAYKATDTNSKATKKV